MTGSHRKRKPLPFNQVDINDAFWAPRIAANREHGLEAVYQQLKSTRRLEAYHLDWTPESTRPKPHVFWDSDVAKWLEGACYSLITHPDASLRAKVEEVVDLILSAQDEDGYINPYFTVVAPQARLSNLRDKHELYCAGHLIEAAIAHHRATGDQRFLDGMQRFADLIDKTFGAEKLKKHGFPGHEEIELALVKLYRHTGEKRYLDLARYFVEERGRSPHYFDLEAQQRGEDPGAYWAGTHAYTQSHRPVIEQREVVGHAVRAMYLYSGMADLAQELDDEQLLDTLKTLWEDLTSRKLYLTGGIGQSKANEGFAKPYDLPNLEAYAETCAAIGLVFWAQRMLQLDLDSRYADIMERALYNGMLSGVSLSGDRFFYVNPLASDGSHHRQPFYACSCCPPNIDRILPTLGEYIYSQSKDEVAVHLYVQSRADITLESGSLQLIQETDYPWDGVVCIRCKMELPFEFTLKFRQPGWCLESRAYLNGQPLSMATNLEGGYFSLTHTWQPGDVLRLQWLMPVRQVYAHSNIRQNIGKTALMRGPLVYCLEAIDQSVPLHHVRLPQETAYDSQFEPDLLDGVVTVLGSARAIDLNIWGNALYRPEPPALQAVSIKAIPYFAWDNREPGEMLVWLPLAHNDD